MVLKTASFVNLGNFRRPAKEILSFLNLMMYNNSNNMSKLPINKVFCIQWNVGTLYTCPKNVFPEISNLLQYVINLDFGHDSKACANSDILSSPLINQCLQALKLVIVLSSLSFSILEIVICIQVALQPLAIVRLLAFLTP